MLSTEDGSHVASFQGGRDPLTAMTYSSGMMCYLTNQ